VSRADTRPITRKAPPSGAFTCAEEDSNLHPLSVDQALNLVTRVSDPSDASIASRTSRNLHASDVMDDWKLPRMLPRAVSLPRLRRSAPAAGSRIAIASGWSARTLARHAKRLSGERERRRSLVVRSERALSVSRDARLLSDAGVFDAAGCRGDGAVRLILEHGMRDHFARAAAPRNGSRTPAEDAWRVSESEGRPADHARHRRRGRQELMTEEHLKQQPAAEGGRGSAVVSAADSPNRATPCPP
jgi:hypothetical protein